VPANALIEIDIKIAKLREEIARGMANAQIQQAELTVLLDQRAKLIEQIAQKPRRDIRKP
jgi:hypothetical protein